MAYLTLNQQSRRVEIRSFELSNDILFAYFDSLAASDRDDALVKALNIGVLALMEDRLSAFLAATNNELGTELERLKLMFDLKNEVFSKASIKGLEAEEGIAKFLSEFVKLNGYEDEIALTGASSGKLERNKTGDIVCEIGGALGAKVVIESKFNKSISLGEIENRDFFKSSGETALGQLIESQVNRDATCGIIVFDVSTMSPSLNNKIQDIHYVPKFGFVTVVDYLRSDFRNLGIAYLLARDLAKSPQIEEFDQDVLFFLISKTIRDLREIWSIERLVKSNIDNNKKILLEIKKALISFEFSQRYFKKFIENGTLTKQDLMEFYAADAMKVELAEVEDELSKL